MSGMTPAMRLLYHACGVVELAGFIVVVACLWVLFERKTRGSRR